MKYITVKLTEDQARHLIDRLDWAIINLPNVTKEQKASNAFTKRLIKKVEAELVK